MYLYNQERQTFFRFGLRDYTLMLLLNNGCCRNDERLINRRSTFDIFYLSYKEFLNFFFLYWKFVPFSGKGRAKAISERIVRPDKNFRNISLFRFLPFLRKDFVLDRTSENVVTSLIAETWTHDLVNNNRIDDFKLGRNVRLHLQSDLDQRIRLKWRSGI